MGQQTYKPHQLVPYRVFPKTNEWCGKSKQLIYELRRFSR